MPEMSTLSGKSKIPMLPSQGASYAKWSRWVDAFSSCLTLKGLYLFAALDSTMPVEFPEDEAEDESEDRDTRARAYVIKAQRIKNGRASTGAPSSSSSTSASRVATRRRREPTRRRRELTALPTERRSPRSAS